MGPAVIERLLAKAVPRQDEFTVLPIPQREGKHACRLLQRCPHPPRRDRRQQHLGVRMPLPGLRLPGRSQFGADVFKVVNLAVISDHIAAGR